MLLLELNFLN